MNDSLYASFLGALQGLTEFLPVSSSGHLIVVSSFVDGEALPLSLNISLHLGTLTAVLVYFWRDWYQITVCGYRRIALRESSYHSDQLLPALVVGSIPAGVVGITMQSWIEENLHSPIIVAIPLAVVGIALWYFDRRARTDKALQQLTLVQAFLIGCAQATALWPGVSRSGATILGARLTGLGREDAARFSFLLGTPAMLGAAVLNLEEILQATATAEFAIAFTSSAIVGCLAINGLLRLLRNFGFGAFAIYRVGLAILILALSA